MWCSRDDSKLLSLLLLTLLFLLRLNTQPEQRKRMSGGGGGSRVPIPTNVRKIIQDIREITVKQHTDDEIYAVLRECSMDPNETAQKLLYLDTFHEVRRRRDRKKEGLSSSASEESRSKQGGHVRGGRGAPGGYSFNFNDGGGGRNLAIRRENGVNHISERNNAPSKADLQKKTNTAPHVTRVSAVAPHSSTANQSNGKSGHGSAGQSLIGSVVNVSKSSSAANDNGNQANVQPQAAVVAIAASPTQTVGSITSTDQVKSLSSSDQLQTVISGVYSSSSDPVLAPTISRNPGVGSAITREVGSNRVSAEPNHVKGNKLEEAGDLSASKNEKSGSMNSTRNFNATKKSNEVEINQLSDPSQLSSSSLNGSLRLSSSCGTQPPPANVTEVSISAACVQSSAELRQHVTFPNHFQVPEALKSGLTFGSFDTFCPSERSNSGTDSEDSTSPTRESSIGNDEAATSSNQSASLTEQGDHLDHSHSSSYLFRNTPASEGNSITGTDSKTDQPKQEALLAHEGHPILNVQSAQNYGLNFMSAMLGTQQVQFEGTESQTPDATRFPSFVSSSSQAVSPSPTPPLQSSIPVPPQSIPIFRPPYPPNFFPYGHYYPPFYVSPMHQYLGHNGYPQQPSAANMYHLPAAAVAAGIKFPLPQFKPGTNTGNTAHIGIPSGSFISPLVGYAPSPTVNTGSSSGHEDLAVSQLKENQIYSTGQVSEGSAVWIQAPPGQDMSSLQVNSMYNLTPQGQHLTFPQTQTAHGAFAGIYQPAPTVASPSTLLQQSQAAAGPVETVGPPAGSYQQPQPQPSQINWNSNF